MEITATDSFEYREDERGPTGRAKITHFKNGDIELTFMDGTIRTGKLRFFPHDISPRHYVEWDSPLNSTMEVMVNDVINGRDIDPEFNCLN